VFLGGLWDEMYFFEINFLSLIVKTETCCSPGVGMRAIMQVCPAYIERYD